MIEVRRDPLGGHVVLMATDRIDRPNEFESAPPRRAASRADACPFCPHNERLTPEPRLDYPPFPQWTTRVVPNRFPAVELGAGRGRHEVLIESPRHVTSWCQLTPAEQHTAIDAMQRRVQEALAAGFPYAQWFKNEGADAGASIQHVHSQLIATPEVPSVVAGEVCGAARFGAGHPLGCYCCWLAAQPSLVVARSRHHLAVCPPASRFAYEVWALPANHEERFELSPSESLADLAELVAECWRAWRGNWPAVGVNALLHSLPVGAKSQGRYHWHLEMSPRLARIAGYELATGRYINTVAPEQAASQLRAWVNHPQTHRS